MIAMMLAAVAMQAGTPAARACTLTRTDTVRIEAAVRGLFDALAKDDRAAYRRATTADFWTFDAGERMSATQLFDLVEGAHRKGRVINWSIGPVGIGGGCDMAWAAWENDGAAGTAGAMKPRRWLESAVLRRSQSGCGSNSSIRPRSSRPPPPRNKSKVAPSRLRGANGALGSPPTRGQR